MELLELLAVIGGAILVVYLYVSAIRAINRHSQGRYAYEPINLRTSLFAVVPWVIFVAGFVLGSSNIAIGIAATILLFVGLALWIMSKSSISIAILAIPLLVLTGAGLVILAVVLFLIFDQKKEQSEPQK